MDTNPINNTILKILYLTIILSIIFKNTDKLIPQLPNILPSLENVNETLQKNINIIPLSGTLYNRFFKSLYKYLIILALAFIISFIVFYSTYKIIKFVKNINNSNTQFENIYENDIIHNINLKINKKNKEDIIEGNTQQENEENIDFKKVDKEENEDEENNNSEENNDSEEKQIIKSVEEIINTISNKELKVEKNQ